MRKLIKIEYLKIKHYTVFRAFMALYFIFVPLLFWAVSLIKFPFLPGKSELFGFPTVWPYLTYVSSFCLVFPGLLLIVLVCNDISYKTQKQNVIDGLSKKQVIFSKFYLILMLTLMVGIFNFLIGFIFGAIYSSPLNFYQGIESLFYFTVQTFGFLSLSLLISVLLRKTSLSVLAFLILFFIAGALLKGSVGNDIAQLTPINALNDLVPFPFFKQLFEMQRMNDPTAVEPLFIAQWIRMLIGFFYVAIFVLSSYSVMKKRDL